jgi:MOSC domain-containing protein YiiM
MKHARIVAIYISPNAGGAMCSLGSVKAVAGKGLLGDRYCNGTGSWQKSCIGKRQITLIDADFFAHSDFLPAESRRNLVTEGIELMSLIDKEFAVGSAVLRGVKYCEPCQRPSALLKRSASFTEQFHGRGGLIAEILKSGSISAGSEIVLHTQ